MTDSNKDKIVELETEIKSLTKKNDDLLELIEKLSLKNIEIEKLNNSLNDELEKKDKFFSILSHDLRGQMGNMINSSDLLVHSFDDLDFTDIKSILEMLNKSIRKNYSLLDNLLLWASLERDRINFTFARYQITDIINYSIDNLKNDIEKKNIAIYNNVPDNIYVEADKEFLGIVFNNIFSNAVKFSNPGNKIEVGLSDTSNNFIIIIIRDYGIGFDNETLNDLFQIDKIHSNYGTEKETGTGMGLYITKKILTSMKGELKIITELDRGTSVSIYLKKA